MNRNVYVVALVGTASLTACVNRAASPSASTVPTQPPAANTAMAQPWAPMFEVGRTWNFQSTTRQSDGIEGVDEGGAAVIGSDTFVCKVDRVDPVPGGRLSVVTCAWDRRDRTVTRELGHDISLMPAGTWLEIGPALWHRPGRAFSTRDVRRVDWQLADDGEALFNQHSALGDGERATKSKPTDAGWCLERRDEAGHEHLESLCIRSNGDVSGLISDSGGYTVETVFRSW